MKDFFFKGHHRTIMVKKNIIISFILKVIDIGTGLLLIPLVLDYLDKQRYGIWLTMTSIVTWFTFFDVGLGHGLRNKLSEAFAHEKNDLASKYISTTYAVITLISVSFLAIFLLINSFLDWSVILNTTDIPKSELGILAIVVFSFFSFRLIFKVIDSVIYATQKPAMKDMIDTLGKVIVLIIIYILLNTTEGSLLYFGICYSAAPVFVIIVFSIVLYSKSFKQLTPKIKQIDFSLFRELFSLGGKFFIIQIAAVVIYSTDNIIIAQLFSPAEVTPYQIANRYFSIILMGFSIVVTPYWSAITEAYEKKEIGWIKNSIKKLMQLWSLAILVLFIMLLFSGKVYKLWIGNKVSIPFVLSAGWALFTGIQTLNIIFVNFINGTGKIKLQMLMGIALAVINIPFCILLAKYLNMGVVGVITATIIGQIIGIFLCIIQYRKILNGELFGIWGK